MQVGINTHDIIFHIIFGNDVQTILEFVHASATRLQAIVDCKHLKHMMDCVVRDRHQIPVDMLKALFFLFLNVDMVLKEYVCNTGSKEVCVSPSPLTLFSPHKVTSSTGICCSHEHEGKHQRTG